MMHAPLIELPLASDAQPLSERALEFLKDGRSRMKSVRCFDFVPSNYENAWNALAQLDRGHFCEWGSGLGIVTGLAELLGFEATGIELDPELAELSRSYLRDHGLKANIFTADFFQFHYPADVIYVYGWPGQLLQIEQIFAERFSPSSRLLICYGQDDIRCLQSQPAGV